jgi:ABC-type arginine/histidine transport system permease subunit
MAKSLTEIRSLARSHTRTAVNVLVGIMRSKDATAAARVLAANAILDRGWGKTAQPMEHGKEDANFNTFEGARSIDEGFVSAARLLGASEWQITRTVVIPSTMAWVFASLSPAIWFALIGVIVGEFIGAERGIGRLIIESEARAEASGMMVAVIVLMMVGVALSAVIWRLQAYLLRWQQHNMAE